MKIDVESSRITPQNAPRYYLILKRIFDFIGSLTSSVLLAPLMFIVALIIKLTSPGPIFFHQIRLGQNGQDFTFLKFRTMYIDMDEMLHSKFISHLIDYPDSIFEKQKKGPLRLPADDRITWIGGFLRKTALDELPQLFSVLKGDMSFVGPRPLMRFEWDFWLENSEGLDRDLMKARLTVKPGITGLWQICDKTEISFREWIKIDFTYVEKRSFMLDLKILFKTISIVMKGKAL